MKILNLGSDNSVLNKNFPLAIRIVGYGDLTDKYIVLVPSKENEKVVLSNKVQAYGVKTANKLIGLFRICKLAKKLIKQEKFNVITVQDQYYLCLIGWWLAKRFNIGLEVQVHGFEKFFGLRKLIAKFVIPKANAVRTVSQRLKRRLINEFGIKEERITVVPIYVDIRNLITPSKPSDGGNLEKEKRDKFVFLTVGRLAPIKNIEMQIRAIKNLELRIKNYELRNKYLELWVVGDGSERENLKLKIENLGLEDRVKLLGWQDDLNKFYKQADVFLLTSDYEGWGMAVIEAASYGLPIIMTDVGCAGEVIVNGESGIIIPAGGQKELEEAMIRLVEDKELRKKLGDNVLQAVKNLLSKEETLKLYQRSWKLALINK